MQHEQRCRCRSLHTTAETVIGEMFEDKGSFRFPFEKQKAAKVWFPVLTMPGTLLGQCDSPEVLPHRRLVRWRLRGGGGRG